MNERKCYWIDLPATDVSDVCDILELRSTTGRHFRILTLILGQVNATAPTADESLQIQWIRGITTSGTTGATAPTPRSVLKDNAASGVACEVFNTVVALAVPELLLGPKHILSVKVGIERPYTEQEAFESDGTMVLRLLTNPAITYKLTGSVLIEEFNP